MFLVGLPICAQAPSTANISKRPLSQEQLAIYRDFLSHYGKYEEQLSNLLGMQPITVPFMVYDPLSIRRGPFDPGGRLHDIHMEPQSDEVHQLPSEIMRFSNFDSVSHRIVAAAKPYPRYASPKGTKGVGPDGWALTQFTLSEIIFDVTHRYAVFNFAADCKCLGGQGSTVLYEFKRGKWTKAKFDLDHWVG